MKKSPFRSALLTALLVVPLAALVVWAVQAPWAPDSTSGGEVDGGVREVVVRAHAWGFSPRVIHVAPGEKVRFVALSEDIGHGFAINELGVNLPLRAGQALRSPAVTVNLPEGIYEIHCSAFCGLGHPAMKGRLVVGAPHQHLASLGPWLASLAVLVSVAGFAAVAAVRVGRGRRP
jgi:cytochrome c oxidase subunit 2